MTLLHLQVGEFVEVHNGSKTDPAAWVAKVHKVHEDYYMVRPPNYPF
jgi:hypothetical protein